MLFEVAIKLDCTEIIIHSRIIKRWLKMIRVMELKKKGYSSG